LAGSLPGTIHIDDDPGFACPVEHTTGGNKRVSSQQILLKARAQGFHRWLIESGKKAGERRAMRQLVSAKESHERRSPGSEPLVKRLQCRFTQKGIANQHRDKIDQVILAKASAGETHLFLNELKPTSMQEHLGKDRHFSQKGRNGGNRFRRDLDRDQGMRHTGSGSSLSADRCLRAQAAIT